MGSDAQDAQDWVCVDCGNKNYASRTKCNMRRCQAPRPGSGGMGPEMGGMGGMPQQHPAQLQPYYPPMTGSGMAANASGGNWDCPACGNNNYASRQVCNRRTCGLPRPAPGSSPPPAVGDKRGREWSDGAATGSGSAPQRNGDWVCPKCNNLNFSSREVCNMRNCEEAKPAMHNGQVLREGEWVCPKCENVNFATRMVCNMRTCAFPKPSTNSDAPPAYQAAEQNSAQEQPAAAVQEEPAAAVQEEPAAASEEAAAVP